MAEALLDRVERLVEKHPERWASLAHYVRSALIRALEEDEKSK